MAISPLEATDFISTGRPIAFLLRERSSSG